MKKIFILALTFMLLSVLPAFAANETTVYVENYNNIEDGLLVTVSTSRDDFEGATIKVGDKITYDLEASGAGKYGATIDLSGLDRAGEVTVTVIANYSGGESETIEKTVSVLKMAGEVTKFTKTNTWLHNVPAAWNGGAGDTTCYNLDEFGNETEDKGAFLFRWKDQDPFKAGDTRVGLQFGAGSNADEGIYYIEHDIYFIYGDEEKIPVPSGVRFMQYYRTETNTSGYPVYSTTGKTAETDIRDFITKDSGGKLADGTQLYTNTWYRVRIVIDKYTKNDDGSYKGGLSYYYAVADEEGNFGSFKLISHHENVYLLGICGWRYEFLAPDADFSFAFKNFKFVKLSPKDAWYLEDTECSDNKIKLTFSEDMGNFSTADVKLFSKYILDENGDTVFEEIPASSLVNLGENKYALSLTKSLLYGKDYEIRLANNFKSAAGAIAFKEPAQDDNGDGFWSFSNVTAPKYPLNISKITDGGNKVTVKINNTDVINKYIAVCWLTDDEQMVEYKIKYIDENTSDDTLTFTRTKNDVYSNVKAYVFDLDNSSESEEIGKTFIYDSK